jgi:alkylation response protein AidB-like acyl-CoA dehydrogenase
MIDLLSDFHRERYSEFREFVKAEVEPLASQWDKNGAIPRDFIRYLGENRFFGALMPEALDGMGWDHTTYGLLNEAFGRASSSLTVLFTVQNMVASALLKWGSPAQLRQWIPPMARGEVIAAFALTEPAVGSEISAIKTSFTRKGNKLLLDGTKRYITFGGAADVCLVFGYLDGESVACMVETGRPGIKITPIEGMLGFRACHLAQLEFDRVELSPDAIIGKPGFAISHVAPIGLHCGRLSTAFSSIGLIRGCLETSIARAMDRTVAGGTVDKLAPVRSLIADMGLDYDNSLTMGLQAAQSEDRHSVKAVERTIAAKLTASRNAVKAANNTVQICGAFGCHEGSSPAGRYYRDAKIMEIIEGTSQVLQDVLSAYYLRQYRPARNARQHALQYT